MTKIIVPASRKKGRNREVLHISAEPHSTAKKAQTLFSPGTFVIGCNYWASHAGTHMWKNWCPKIVESDCAILKEAGMQVLRVFPLWSDFQPVTGTFGFGGALKEFRFGEMPLPEDLPGKFGVSTEMLHRFESFCEIARRYNLRIVVGIVTGWMSGRTYCPPVLEGRNLHTDPLALQFQSRFIRIFVERFRDESSIIAWDLGNECNCMGTVSSREEAWVWTATVTSAIRLADSTRPVISGMHTLMPTEQYSGGWTIQDQAELTDILTTHPYPLWSRHTSQDPLDTLRTTAHAAAESRFYADIGGKPCFAEEIGTMGPMMGDSEAAARFLRVNCFSLWANDCRGLFWWCAFDQQHLDHAPYDWLAVERELGLFCSKGTPKSVTTELATFRRVISKIPGGVLPPPVPDAVCLLTRGQDQWAAAYAAWILALQVKFTLRFAFIDAPLPSSRFYILPSVSGMEPLPRRRWHELLQQVQSGSELLVTLNDGVLEPFGEVFGVRIRSRSHRASEATFILDGARVVAKSGLDLKLAVETGAEVLASTEDDSAMVVRHPYGRGRAMLCTVPVETQLMATTGAFHGTGAESWHHLYRLFSERIPRLVDCDDPSVAITIHGNRYAVLVNHGPNPAMPRFAAHVNVRRWIHGGPLIAPHDGTIVELDIATPS